MVIFLCSRFLTAVVAPKKTGLTELWLSLFWSSIFRQALFILVETCVCRLVPSGFARLCGHSAVYALTGNVLIFQVLGRSNCD